MLPAPSFAAAICVALTTTNLFAHGGQYRGPGNVVPPSAGAAAGGSAFRGPGDVLPSTGGASTSGRTSAASGVARPTSTRSAGAAVPRGYQVGDDLGRWEFWWEFGKDPFLDLRQRLYGPRGADPELKLWNPRLAARVKDIMPPNARDISLAAASLRALLSATRDRDTSSACVIALAKIGTDAAGFSVPACLAPLLKRGDQELRETAALAYGISGDLGEEPVRTVLDLVGDTAAGRALCGGGEVNERTRAFAAYGAGLMLRRSRAAATSLRISKALLAIVRAPQAHGRDVTVAAVEALALFPRDWRGAAPAVLREDIVAALGRYYQRPLGAGAQLIQAHVPTAIARLVPLGTPTADRWRASFRADLAAGLRSRSAAPRAKVNHHIAQSCVLALGELSVPWQSENSQSHEDCRLLTEVYAQHRDQQTRAFAALALATAGGAKARAFLLGALQHANKAVEQPWIAISLGVIAAKERRSAAIGGDPHDPHELTEALTEAFRAARNPSTVGAVSIALGMSGCADARDLLRQRLIEHRKRDAVAGYVALALGLLQDARSVPELRELRRGATRRPFVLLQTVRALGLLGDHTLTAQLVQELSGPGQSIARLSATAAALGQIGDRRCLGALRGLCEDRDAAPISRAFAAVAVGSVCDKDPLPWNAAYATHVNYRAATATLTDGAAGILDLL